MSGVFNSCAAVAENAHSLAAILALQIVEIVRRGYSHVLFPGTTFGKDLAPCVAARLDVQQISDIMAVHGPSSFDRPTYAAMSSAKSDAALPRRCRTGHV